MSLKRRSFLIPTKHPQDPSLVFDLKFVRCLGAHTFPRLSPSTHSTPLPFPRQPLSNLAHRPIPFPKIPPKGTSHTLLLLFPVGFLPLDSENQTAMHPAHPHSHSTVSVTSLTASPWMLVAVQR